MEVQLHLMLSRTSPSAYSNLRARSFPEPREYASPIRDLMCPHPVERVLRIVDGYGDVMCHGNKMNGNRGETITGSLDLLSPKLVADRRWPLGPETAKSAILNLEDPQSWFRNHTEELVAETDPQLAAQLTIITYTRKSGVSLRNWLD